MIDISEVQKAAQAEIEQEEFRRRVDEMKQKLREKRPFWERILPFKIRIERRKNV